MAYGDYTRKSFEQTKSFVEKLAGVRSLDQAIEIQTEFAKQAYETFVTDAQKIRELYSGLAKQTFEGAVAKDPGGALNLRRFARATGCLDAVVSKRGSGFPGPFFARVSAVACACPNGSILLADPRTGQSHRFD